MIPLYKHFQISLGQYKAEEHGSEVSAIAAEWEKVHKHTKHKSNAMTPRNEPTVSLTHHLEHVSGN